LGGRLVKQAHLHFLGFLLRELNLLRDNDVIEKTHRFIRGQVLETRKLITELLLLVVGIWHWSRGLRLLGLLNRPGIPTIIIIVFIVGFFFNSPMGGMLRSNWKFGTACPIPKNSTGS
jgi:hypothetical protein